MKMKKIITGVLVCSCLSLGFTEGNCSNTSGQRLFYDFFLFAIGAYSSVKVDDAGTESAYIIGIGPNGTIYRSSGADTIYFTPRSSGTNQRLNSVSIYPGGNRALVVGNNGAITRSLDRCETWGVRPQVTTSNLNAVCFGFGGFDFAVGDSGTILRGANFGANWTVFPSGTTRKLNAVSSHSNNIEYLLAVGDKGAIVRSTNFGLSWVNASMPDTTINFYCINPALSGSNEISNFFVAGSSGRIYKSTNFGANWVLKNSGTTNTLRSIYFTSDDSGAVTGDNGTVKMTTNGGDSWFTDTYFSNVTGSVKSCIPFSFLPMKFIALSDSNTLYIASEDSIISVIGINNISLEVPNEFSLSQNYPNPFNPKTNINLDLIKSGFVKLVIYDVSGKEVETLVSQELKAGTYKIDWDGSKHSSGIYFYKIFTDDFVQTKKMVLVK